MLLYAFVIAWMRMYKNGMFWSGSKKVNSYRTVHVGMCKYSVCGLHMLSFRGFDVLASFGHLLVYSFVVFHCMSGLTSWLRMCLLCFLSYAFICECTCIRAHVWMQIFFSQVQLEGFFFLLLLRYESCLIFCSQIPSLGSIWVSGSARWEM